MGNSNITFKTLVVITPADCQRLLKLYPRLVNSIPYGEVCFVGAPEVGDIVSGDKELSGRATAIDENSIIPFNEVHALVAERMKNILAGRELPRGITGWYYQQFLKIQYALTCEDEYYMVWDGDTIPCRKLNMFQDGTGKPYFDLKHELHQEYFETMEVLLPGYNKIIKKSFISEHMLFKTTYMKELIRAIESNDNIPGSKFWEKIFNAIPEDKIQNSSFSEFETYGTFVTKNHPDEYVFRNWHSFRLGGEFFSVDTIKDRDFRWLAKDFSSISFEKGHSVRPDNANIFDNPRFQDKLTPRQMLEEAQKEYQDGYKEVWDDDNDTEIHNFNEGGYNKPQEVDEKDELIRKASAELANRRQQIENLLDSFDKQSYVRDVYHRRYIEEADRFSGKGVVYSGIFGAYDAISEPEMVEDDLDYVLFTDMAPQDYQGKWRIVVVDNPDNYDPATLTRIVKMHPWDYLDGYDWSVWVDGKFRVVGDFRRYVSYYGRGSGMICYPHYTSSSIDEEAQIIAAAGKADLSELQKQISKYLAEGYEGKGYLVEAGCLVRSHHDDKLRAVMDDWWKEFRSYNHKRDQMSFDYACWKNDYLYDICDLLIYSNPWVRAVAVH